MTSAALAELTRDTTLANGKKPRLSDIAFEIPIEQIDPPKDNVRGKVGDVAGLAQSISSVGLLEPVIVVPRDGDRYEIVAGSRRLAAAKLAGLDQLPAIVRILTEQERLAAMVVENLQREDLSPLEEATAYQRLIELGYNQTEVAKIVGHAKSHISKRLALLDLPKDAQTEIDSGGIRLEDAIELAKLRSYPEHLAAVIADYKRERRRGWQADIGGLVAAALRKVALDAKIAKTRDELARSDVLVVELKGDGYYKRPPSGMKFVKQHTYGDMREVEMDPAKHAKLPCRAVAIDDRGSVLELCTTPANHPKRSDASKEAKQRRRKAHEKELRDARKIRHEFLRGLLVKPGPDKDLVAIVVRCLIGEAWQSKRKIACEILNLNAEEYDKTSLASARYGYADKWELALEAEAAKPGRALAVGLAIQLAVTEELLGKAWNGLTRHKTHFDYLEAHGYEISPAERRELNGKAPR